MIPVPLFRVFALFCLVITTFGLAACDQKKDEPSTESTTVPEKPVVVATTGMVAELVRGVAGDLLEVQTLLDPGVDPHLYQPSPASIKKLSEADAVFYNGLHLEGRMDEVFEGLERKGRIILAVTDAIPRTELIPVGQGTYDPHVWMDVKLWASCAGIVVDTLSEKWPKHQAAFAENGRQLDARLQKLDAEIRAKTAALPEASRVLVSTHDAFAYYGKTYGFRVVAVQGISTVTEAGLADVTRVIDTIRELKVPAVFVESSVPRAVMERVSKDAGVKIGAELFADALGNPGEMMLGFDVGTYPGMMLYNSSAIVAALATKP